MVSILYMTRADDTLLIRAQELATECGSQALNPNELGAVLKVLSLLAAELEADTSTNLPTVRGFEGEAWLMSPQGETCWWPPGISCLKAALRKYNFIFKSYIS